jgi:hypothetical protein
MHVPPADARRERLNEWAALWEPATTETAPAYTRQWGDILAGLMAAQPPAYTELVDDPAVPVAMLAELTEQAVPIAAGLGAVYMRPIRTRDTWAIAPLKPTNVQPVWSHHRLDSATVWDWCPDPRHKSAGGIRRVLAFVERWDDEPGVVTAEVWEGTTTGSSANLDERIAVANHPTDPDTDRIPAVLADHPYTDAIRGHDTTPRRIIPFVWRWEDGHPVPVFRGNEPAIRGLIRLSTQEQQDAEMARHRIAVARDALCRSDVLSDTGAIISHAGFNPTDNILTMEAGMSAQNPGEGGVQVITFPDSLVQRDRIERRENTILEAIGINPQSIGRSVGGRSDSAAAKRADQQMTSNTIAGPARRWQAALTEAVQQIHTLSGGQGDAPAIQISEGLKMSLGERVEVVTAATSADAMSTRTKLKTMHPEWDGTQIDEELSQLAAEGITVMPDQP